MSKTVYIIEYKYKNDERNPHWNLYDKTRVKKWSEVQEERMKQAHPGAEYRVVEK